MLGGLQEGGVPWTEPKHDPSLLSVPSVAVRQHYLVVSPLAFLAAWCVPADGSWFDPMSGAAS